jgi:apolipoprotein N-acyltransferase
LSFNVHVVFFLKILPQADFSRYRSIMNKLKTFFKKYWLPILSGILIGFSWIPFPAWLTWIAWTPLFFWMSSPNRTLRETFWGAWWTQFILSLIGFHWIAYVSHVFGFLPKPVAAVVLLLFCAFVHLHIPLMAALSQWVRKKWQIQHVAYVFTLPFFFSLAEMAWPAIFPWNMGYPLMKNPIPGLSGLIQWADVIGVAGLSTLVFFCSSLGAWILIRRNRKALLTALAFKAVLFGMGLWGQQRGEEWKKTSTEKLNTLIVQANIGNLEKVYAEKGAGYQQSIADRYFRMTREGLSKAQSEGKKVDLIIWPESAYPDFLNTEYQHRVYSSQLVQFVRDIQTPLLTGAYSRDGQDVSDKKDYNALFVFDAFGQLTTPPYHKTELLVFGEYTPFGETFPVLKKYNPAGSGFGRGKGPQIMLMPREAPKSEVKIGAQICYESLYPEFSRKLALLGADVIVNLTNDSWFGPTFEPHQHMLMTLSRAIETRRPLIRSTNTGISTVILASGEILEQSPLFEPWSHAYEVFYKPEAPLTFYTKFGAWLPLALLLLLLAILRGGRARGTP